MRYKLEIEGGTSHVPYLLEIEGGTSHVRYQLEIEGGTSHVQYLLEIKGEDSHGQFPLEIEAETVKFGNVTIKQLRGNGHVQYHPHPPERQKYSGSLPLNGSVHQF